MAGENGRLARYHRMIMEPIPQFNDDIERLFVSVLKSYAKKYNVEAENVSYTVIYRLTKNMSKRMRKRYWDDHVLCKIMQLRRQFVMFRRFTDRAFVSYNEANNEVVVSPEYFALLPNGVEPAQDRLFREIGCPHYKNLKITFLLNRFHLLVDEPEDLHWNRIIPRAGDNNVDDLNFWGVDDHDSDDDSDYANEFDD